MKHMLAVFVIVGVLVGLGSQVAHAQQPNIQVYFDSGYDYTGTYTECKGWAVYDALCCCKKLQYVRFSDRVLS